MKKSVKFLALVMALLMICLPLTACGKRLSGKYEHESWGIKTTYEFKGNKVTYSVGGEEVEGTYEIKDDKIIFEFDGNKLVELINGEELDFEKTDDGIEIEGIEYKKAD